MASTFLKTFRQINDPKIIKALVLATLLTFVSIIIAVMIGVGLVDRLFDFFSETLQSWFGKGESWFYAFAQFLGGSLTLVIAYFFFAGIHGAFVGMFIDDILDAIHRNIIQKCHGKTSIYDQVFYSLPHSFPNYILKLIASPSFSLVGLSLHWAFLQVILNGYLLGKEYGQLVEFRIPASQGISPPLNILLTESWLRSSGSFHSLIFWHPFFSQVLYSIQE